MRLLRTDEGPNFCVVPGLVSVLLGGRCGCGVALGV